MTERPFRYTLTKSSSSNSSNVTSSRSIPILPLHLQQTVYQQQQCGQWVPGSPLLMSRVSPLMYQPPHPPQGQRPRQDSTSDILPMEWISSPLMEGFVGYYNTNPTDTKEELSSSLPYLDTTWSPSSHSSTRSTNGSSSSNSPNCVVTTGIATTTNASGTATEEDHTQATQYHPLSNTVHIGTHSPTMVHPTSPPLEDWDLLKPRSFSTDFGQSPGHLASYAPLFFPMETESNEMEHPPPSSTCTTTSVQHQHHPPPSMLPPRSYNGAVYMQEDLTTATDSNWSLSQASNGGSHQPLPTYTPDTTTQCTTRPSMPMHLPVRGLSELHSTDAMYALATQSSPQQLHPNYHSTSATRYVPIVSHTRNNSTRNETIPTTTVTTGIKLVTPLNQCYWKNGRKNLQCFPTCPEHNDFYSMKMSNAKHASVGVCRGAVYCHVTLEAAPGVPITRGNSSKTIPSTMGRDATLLQQQRMRYECGVGATGTGGSAQEVFVLGQFERVPQCQTDENTNRDSDLDRLLPRPANFASSAAFEAFRYGCFQAVEMEERRIRVGSSNTADQADMVQSTWFFLPDVWKVQPILKKKRKATRSMPAQTYPFCFRVFIYVRDDAVGSNGTHTPVSSNSSYRCLATATSSFFELYSTRTVDRVKRKHWTNGSRSSSCSNSSSGSRSHDASSSNKRVAR